MLTVADILATDGLDLTLQAGAGGCTHPVRWVHTSELGDPTPWLRGGELLLTTGQPLQGDPASYVRRLAQHGLPALGLGLGFGFDEAPAAALEEAERHSFPLFTIPYEVPFIAISEAVFAALVDARVQAIESLTHLVLDDRGLDAMLAEMARASGSALCLRDAGGRVLAETAEIQPGDPGAIRLPLVTGSQVEAELLAQPGERCDRQLLHHVRTVLAVELLKRRAVTEAEQRLAGDLVESVLSGEIGERELRRKLAAFGFAGELPLSFALLRPAQPGARQLAELLEDAGRFGPAGARDGGVAVLIEAADDDAAEAGARRLLDETGAAAGGVGRVRVSPSELHRSYDEALYATIARPGNGHPALATWRDLGSIQLLLALHGERGVELYCETLLGPLVAHDRDHGSALVESLQAFIEANGRWADAAAELHVHRHTLRYRMRQIEQLTGRSLTDARDRLELWMALRAHALQETHRDGRATPV